MSSVKTNNFIDPASFDSSKVTYSEVKSFGTHSKNAFVIYNNDSNLGLKLPKMRMPFGVSTYEEEGQNPKHVVDVSFDTDNTDPKVKKFYEAIEEFDKKLLSDAKHNSLAWLKKKKVTDSVLETLYSPSIKKHKNKTTGEYTNEYPPKFRGKLMFRDGKMKCSVFDHNRKKIDGDALGMLSRGAFITGIVKCTGIWFSNGKFGATWAFEQIKLDKPRENKFEYNLSDLLDDSD